MKWLAYKCLKKINNSLSTRHMFEKNIFIDSIEIGSETRPYVIAEAGSNFNQSLDMAKELIDVAADSGAQAVKFQLFKAELLYPDRGDTYRLFKSIELNEKWVPILKTYSDKKGISFLASPFDIGSVNTLEKINVSAYKIASSEIVDIKLLIEIAKKKKPMIISTGMSDIIDVKEALNTCLLQNNKKVILLQCGALYPIPAEQINLNVLKTYKNLYGGPIGFSDHSMNNIAAIVAVGLGARVFEKHFTLDKELDGPDHSYAIEPNELKKYVSEIQEAFLSLGSEEKNLLERERYEGRRLGLYAAKNISQGDSLTPENVCIKRPAIGIRSRYRQSVLGFNVKINIKKGDPIFWHDI